MTGLSFVQAPEGLQWGTLRRPDGAMLRWAKVARAGADRTVVFLGGFSEFIEKYFEAVGEIADMNYSVWCLDWRGQGGSQPHEFRPMGRDFDRDADDLIAFVSDVVAPSAPPVVVAHSMGGAIALHALRRVPALFSAAVLSAPMLALPPKPLPSGLARIFAIAACALGLGGVILPGARMWPPDPEMSVDKSLTSHDPVRYRIQSDWFRDHPEMRIEGLTFGWVNAAMKFCARLNRPEVLKRIDLPILLGIAGIESFVDPAALRRAGAILPHCRAVEFPEAKHELFHEADRFRDVWMAEVEKFLADPKAALADVP